MASLDLDEIDDFLSSLDPENYSLRHAFMPLNHEDVKHPVAPVNGSASERKPKDNPGPRASPAASEGVDSKTRARSADPPDADGSPGRSSSDEPSAPSGRPIREQDRFLPLAIVSRLMKECIPTSAKVSRGARHLLQECVSEFIAFVTSEAIERCLADRRKTLTGEDLMDALRALGFDNYVLPMALYLEKIQAQLRGEHASGGGGGGTVSSPREDAEEATRVKEEHEDEDVLSPSASPPPTKRFFLSERHW